MTNDLKIVTFQIIYTQIRNETRKTCGRWCMSLSNAFAPTDVLSVDVDEQAAIACKRIHFGHPWAIQCARTLEAWIFKNGIEMYQGDTKIPMPEDFKDIYEIYWIPFGKEALMEIFTRGIFPMTIKKMSEIDPVPKVVGGRGRIIMQYNESKDEHEYQYYRLNKFNSNGIFASGGGGGGTFSSANMKPDPKVVIMARFGYDPNDDGVLRSPLASLLTDDFEVGKVRQFALSGAAQKADPFLPTEVQDKASEGFGLDGVSTIYNERDVLLSRQQDKLYANAAELESSAKQREVYNDHYADPETRIYSRYSGFSNFDLTVRPPKTFPLPSGHKVTNPNYPPPNPDLKDRKDEFLHNICAAYGIPWSMLAGEGRVLAGIKVNEQSFHETLRFWRNIVAEIFTRVYHIIYERETVDAAMSEIVSVPRDSITKKTLHQKLLSKRIKFVFPMETNDTFDDLVKKYSLKVIPWVEFERLSRRMAGIPEEMKQSEKKDPWNDEEKLLFAGKRLAPSKEGGGGAEPKTKKQKTNS